MKIWSPTVLRILFTGIGLFFLTGGRALAQATANNAPGASSQYYYVYDGRPINLVVDQSRVAIKFAGGSTKAQRSAVLTLSGLNPAASESTGIDAWLFAYTNLDYTDPDQLRQKLDDLSQSPEVEFISPVFTPPTGGWMTVTPEILIRLKPDGSDNTSTILTEINQEAEVIQVDFGDLDRAYRLRSGSRNGLTVLNLANRLAEDPRVEWAEPDMLASVDQMITPNDPGWSSLWGLNNTGQSGGTADMDMDCDLAWDISTGSSDILILVLDDGVQLNHPDLNIAAGADLTGLNTGGLPGNECDKHGTAVSGCVSAIINNGIGTIGSAPDCRVLAAKFTRSNVPCDGSGTFQFSWLVNALAWGENQGARVSNNSNGLPYSSSVASKYQSTYANGMVHFSSAGNDGTNTIGFPASLAEVNAISALNRYGNRASFSNWHSSVTLSAPGEAIYTTDRIGPDGYSSTDYTTVNGTSFSSPYAAGVAGLLLSVDPWLTAGEVESQLYATAVDLGDAGRDEIYGYGFINAYNAIAHARLEVTADVNFGPSPITVNFQGNTARPATGWDWLFGDGTGSTEQNPTHEYVVPGQYTVEVTVHTAERDYVRVEENMISAYADTLDIGEGQFASGVGTVDIYVRNYLPLQSIMIPFTWDGTIEADFVSVSTAGHRSASMSAVKTSIVTSWNAATVTLDAGTGPLLAPGFGPVATLTFSLVNNPPSGSVPVNLWNYSIFALAFESEAGDYVPVGYDGNIEISCCQGIVGDVNSDHGYEPTIGDISFLIDHLFVGGVPLDCLTEADANQSGAADPTDDDLTIGDVSLLIDHLFISGAPLPSCL